MMFFILPLLILKIAAFGVLTFLYETIVAVSLQIQTFMRKPFFVTMVAFFGSVSDTVSSMTFALTESFTSASRWAFKLDSYPLSDYMQGLLCRPYNTQLLHLSVSVYVLRWLVFVRHSH